MKFNPYLSFNGQCEAALKFYEQCLGGTIETMMPYEGSPMADQVPTDWGHKIMHSEFRLGEQIFMGSDCTSDRYEKPQGNSVMLNINLPADAERVFNALAENGTVTMPIQGPFWAERFGTLIDQFGIPWMINCEKAV